MIKNLATPAKFEFAISDSKSLVIPFHYRAIKIWRTVWGSNPSLYLERVGISPEIQRFIILEQGTGLEPAYSCFADKTIPISGTLAFSHFCYSSILILWWR